jgi:hypothetical protein
VALPDYNGVEGGASGSTLRPRRPRVQDALLTL